MNYKQKRVAKLFIAAYMFKQYDNLTKAYVATAAAAFYGVKAAHDANDKLEQSLRTLALETASD